MGSINLISFCQERIHSLSANRNPLLQPPLTITPNISGIGILTTYSQNRQERINTSQPMNLLYVSHTFLNRLGAIVAYLMQDLIPLRFPHSQSFHPHQILSL